MAPAASPVVARRRSMFAFGTPVRFPEHEVPETDERTFGQLDTPEPGGMPTGSLQNPGEENPPPGPPFSEPITVTGISSVAARIDVVVAGVVQAANAGGPKNSVMRKSVPPPLA